MAAEDLTVVGAIVNLSPPGDAGEGNWKAEQMDVGHGLPPGTIRRHYSVDWDFGPVKVSGYVDTDTLEIGVSVSVLGINLGNVYGSLNKGVGLDVNIFLAEGSIKFYLKNAKELWVRLDLEVKFDGSFHGDYKIVTLPI